MTRFRTKYLRLLLFALFLLPIVGPSQIDKVYAAHACNHGPRNFGRYENCGYFLNRNEGNTGRGLLTYYNYNGRAAFLGVHNINQFVGAVRHHLGFGTSACNNPSAGDRSQRRNAAAFIVLTMLGRPAGTPANAPCSSSGSNSFNTWEDRVREYDSRGLIRYNDDGWYTMNTRVQRSTQDVAWYDAGFAITPSIIVRAPDGEVLYMIKKNCANPIGRVQGLPPLSTPPDISCGSVTTRPPDVESEQPFTIRTSFDVSGGPGGPMGYFIFFNFPIAGPFDPSGGHVPRGESGVDEWDIEGLPPGQYTGSFEIVPHEPTNPAGLTCPFDFGSDTPPPIPVVSLPYAKLYGGDTTVGSGFNDNLSPCDPNPDANLRGYNHQGGLNFGLSIGTGTQLAAHVFGTVQEFGSGQQINNQDPANQSPKNLTLANTPPATSSYDSTWGGGLDPSGNTTCIPDYFSQSDAAERQSNPSGPVALGSRSITEDTTIYVDDDAYITGNITFANTTYTDIDDIPDFRLIVRGNIYVHPSVTQLDGIYIAQPTTTNPDTTGRLYTCSPSPNPPTVDQLNTDCQTQLTINGAVAAEQLKLTRSQGTRSQAIRHETPSNPGNPAEVMIFSPEVWLGSGLGSGGDVDSIRALPPVL